jgi:Tfp pilus assembly protein PilW
MRPRPRRLTAQGGFSLVEVTIGMAITVVVAAGVAVGLIQNNDSALATQRQAQMIAVLQNRVEWVHQLLTEDYTSTGFATLALSSNPAKGEHAVLPADPSDPNDFITNYTPEYQTATSKKPYESFLVEKNYNGTSAGVVSGSSSEGETLEVDPTNGKVPAVSYVDLGSGSGTGIGTVYTAAGSVPAGHAYAIVNTYVTIDPEVATTINGGCPTTAGTGSTEGDARRIIVAARYEPANSQATADSTPQYATTLLTNPTPGNQCQHATGFKAGPLVE